MNKKAQVALEQMIIFTFALFATTLIFSYAFIVYTQSIRSATANDALERLVSAADRVYLRGEGNTERVLVFFPNETDSISVLHKCTDGSQSANCGSVDNISFSALKMRFTVFGDVSTIIQESKAKLVIDGFPAGSEAAGVQYEIQVRWTDTGKVELKVI